MSIENSDRETLINTHITEWFVLETESKISLIDYRVSCLFFMRNELE